MISLIDINMVYRFYHRKNDRIAKIVIGDKFSDDRLDDLILM